MHRRPPRLTPSLIALAAAIGANIAPAQAQLSFDGVYGGLFAGHEVLMGDLSGPRGPGTLDAEFGNDGVLGGLFAGYGMQFDGFYVAGEAEFLFSSTEWNHDRNPGGRMFNTEAAEGYALSARLGPVVSPDALIFGRIGWAQRALGTDYRTDSGNRFDVSETQSGLFFGLGGEIATPDGVFYRLEFVHSDFDSYGVTYGGPGNPRTDTFDPSSAQARLSIGYRFGFTEDEAPEAPASVGHSFDGAYVGGQVGYGDVVSNVTGLRGPLPQDSYDVEFAGDGLAGGVFGGYGATADRLYFGAELGAELSGADWDHIRDPSGRDFGVSSNYTVSIDGRLGVLISENNLIYLRGGVGWTDFDIGYMASAGDFSGSSTEFGWRAGLGMEMAVSEDVFLRMDYTVMGYDDISVAYTHNAIPGTDVFDIADSRFMIGAGWRIPVE